MSKIIYGILLALASAAIVLSVGALINIPNPKMVLVIAGAFAFVLTTGFILGKKDSTTYYVEPKDQEQEQVEEVQDE